MIRSKRFHTKGCIFVGIGGLKCPCCAPAPRHRKAFFRNARRALHRMVEKIEAIEGSKE